MDISEIVKGNTAAVEREITAAIPRNRKPAAVYGLIWDFLDRGGKRFRPALCALSCSAVGGKEKDALPAAVSVELFHNFTLIHDDIEDSSEMRRGKPCLHITYGIPLAINAGDGLFMMVSEPLLRMPDSKRAMATQRILHDAFVAVLEGQAMELDWLRTGEWNITESDYFRMAGGKTAALIAAACESGAYLGNAAQKERKALRDFGYAVGVAFQIQDDVLNIIGDEAKYRKEIGGDIREGKRTLMVIRCLSKATDVDRKALMDILSSGRADRSEILEAILLLKKYRSIEYAQKKAAGIVKRAKSGLSILKPSPAKKKLLALADFLIEREY
jgi:geranylgeranyl pyrophosphate synthase